MAHGYDDYWRRSIVSIYPHHATHEVGGDDLIDARGLQGAFITAPTFAGLPAAGLIGRYAYTTDTKQLFWDNGVSWVEIKKGESVQARINFNGTGEITIKDSYNVASITDNGVGDYTIDWDTDFANTNYAVAGSSRAQTAINACRVVSTWTKAVGSLRIITANYLASAEDNADVSVIAMGEQ